MAEFRWRWKGSTIPEAQVTTFLYGKQWAYSVEIDDGPASTLTVSQPLLASFRFSDAPPGVGGGKSLPFVGGAAVFPLRVGTGSPAYLETVQLQQLERAGWAVLNHGYAHRGNSWEPDGALTSAQLNEELFWSQLVLAASRESRRSPAHFVYPNGYMAYQSSLRTVGLLSASRVGGKKPGLGALTDLDRNYLDESVWSKGNDPLVGLPRAPQPGQWVIDFTHGMEAAPTSANHKRWRERLGYIERLGDALWCAPTPAVVAYLQAARAARLQPERGGLALTLPDELPGTRLTVKLSGVPESATAPPDTVLYRQKDTVWLTTPLLNKPDVAPPAALECLYTGPVRSLSFPKPVRIAGVRLLQQGETRPEFRLSLVLTTPGKPQLLAEGRLKPAWGVWLLYALLPNAPATLATGLVPTTDPALTAMEVWGQR